MAEGLRPCSSVEFDRVHPEYVGRVADTSIAVLAVAYTSTSAATDVEDVDNLAAEVHGVQH